MKKALAIFSLAAMGMFSSCSNDDEKKSDPTIIPVGTVVNNSLTISPCIIEVPCNEPELNALSEFRNGGTKKKYYDFCDSTVTIIGDNAGYGGPFYNVRSITEVKGTERKEMEAASAKYKSLTNQ